MRIRSKSSSEWQSRWSAIKSWLRSRRMGLQLLLAFSLGTIVAGGGGLWYVRSGKTWIATLTAPLHAEAQKTVEEVTVTNDLPTLYFDIGFAEFQTMAAQREEALQKGILLHGDDDWARAQIRFQGETIPVRLRLKGDWTDHLGEKKWSFRVKTRNDATLLGMRSFSVQAPHTRNYLNEWLYFEDLRQAGILAPRYSFVNVVVNGESWGIYALEEGFSKELLESQGRRESVIVRFDESVYWQHRAVFSDSLSGIHSDVDDIAATLGTEQFALVDEFNTNQVSRDPVLQAQSNTALGLLAGFQRGELAPFEVFDAELLGRYLAHTNLWGARHGLDWHNERYYYNPLTSRLEPIGYDAFPFAAAYAPFVDLGQYDDAAVMRAYAQEALRISRPEYLERLEKEYTESFAHYQGALLQEFPAETLAAPWERLAERQQLLEKTLHPPQTVYAYRTAELLTTTVNVRVANIIRYPVVLQQLQVGTQTVAIQPGWVAEEDRDLLDRTADPAMVLPSATEEGPQYLTLHIPASVVKSLLPAGTSWYSHTVQLVTQLVGMEESMMANVLPHYPPVLSARVTPPQPTVAEALARYPFLKPAAAPDFLELRAGEWQVSGDLVLPDGVGLVATHPVSLTFEPGALFFANAPLLLSAPEGSSSYFGPSAGHWAGLVVLQAGPEAVSVLENVEIRGTNGIEREGWMTTGGVTFYESPIVLYRCRLLDSEAEDTINIVRSDFRFVETEFGNAASDAFDGDFVHGSLKDCAFHDVHGDGIDLSGSRVQIEGANFLRIYDKGISAGEQSIVTATQLIAHDVALAVVSKDLSTVSATDVTISRARIAGFAAYQKKMEYGPARLYASEVTFSDSSPQTLAQTNSYIEIDRVPAHTVELDVELLYRRLAALAALQPLDYRLGPAIRLSGDTLLTPEVRAGEDLLLSLYWEAVGTPDLDYTIFIHIYDKAGNWLLQQDVRPDSDPELISGEQAGGRSLTSGWRAGEFIEDFHRLTIPEGAVPGEYRILLGMYDWRTDERLPVTTSDGTALPDAIIELGTFEVLE